MSYSHRAVAVCADAPVQACSQENPCGTLQPLTDPEPRCPFVPILRLAGDDGRPHCPKVPGWYLDLDEPGRFMQQLQREKGLARTRVDVNEAAQDAARAQHAGQAQDGRGGASPQEAARAWLGEVRHRMPNTRISHAADIPSSRRHLLTGTCRTQRSERIYLLEAGVRDKRFSVYYSVRAQFCARASKCRGTTCTEDRASYGVGLGSASRGSFVYIILMVWGGRV